MTTKPNTATIFRKRQVLTAKQLTKSLGEYGTQGGAVPYDDDSKQDTSFDLPLGTKTASFGNAYFKGFNIYTQLEVQQLVTAGKLTATDRMVFWNTDTNTLCAWNGTEIVTLTGGNESMKHLYGDGSDGDITYVANAALTKSWYRYNNMTLNSGITLTSSLHVPIVMSVKETLTLNGTINFDNAGGTTTNNYPDSFGAELEGIKGSGMITGTGGAYSTSDGAASFGASNAFVVSENGKGSKIVQQTGLTAQQGQYNTTYTRNLTSTIVGSSAVGAANADAAAMLRHLLAGTLFHTPVAGQGPSGGGGLIIYANNVVIANSFSYSATGTSAGGCLAIAYKSGTVGTYSVSVGNGFSVIGKLL